MSRRTETAYKAKFPGELAQHNEAQAPFTHNPISFYGCVQFSIYWLNLELAIRLRLTPASAAWTDSLR